MSRCIPRLLLLLAGAPLAWTAEPSLSDLSLSELLALRVDAAGLFPVEVSKAPGMAWVIDAASMERLPVLSLGDVLDYHAPGVVAGRHHYEGVLLGHRGVMIESNAKTLFLWNGQNLTPRTHFGYSAGLSLPFLGDIERVEMIQGPGAIQCGSGAINGLINVVPRTGAGSPGARVQAIYGSAQRLVGGEFGYGIVVDDDQDWYLYGGMAQAEGSDAGSSTRDSRSGDNAWEMDPSFRLSLNGSIRGGLGTLSIQALLQRARIDCNTVPATGNAFSSTYGDITSAAPGNQADERGVSWMWGQDVAALRLAWTIPVAPTTSVELSLPAELQQAVHIRRHEAGFGSLVPGETATAGSSEGHVEAKGVLRTAFGDGQNIAIGALQGYRRFLPGSILAGPEPDDGNFESMDAHWTETAVFGEAICTIASDWTVSAGLRFDQVDYSAVNGPMSKQLPEPIMPYEPGQLQETSPRLALAWSHWQPWSVRASYQQGFRTPDINAWLNLARINSSLLGDGQSARPALKPETMESFELGTTLASTDRLYGLTLTGYHNRYSDMLLHRNYSAADVGTGYITAAEWAAIQAAGTPTGHQINAQDDFSSIGFEMLASARPVPALRLEASYGFSKPLDLGQHANQELKLGSANAEEWGRYPTHLIKGDATFAFLERWELTAAVRWRSGIDTTVVGPAANSAYYDSHRTVVNARLNYHAVDGWGLSLVAQNLFPQADSLDMSNGGTLNGKAGQDETLLYALLNWTF